MRYANAIEYEQLDAQNGSRGVGSEPPDFAALRGFILRLCSPCCDRDWIRSTAERLINMSDPCATKDFLAKGEVM